MKVAIIGGDQTTAFDFDKEITENITQLFTGTAPGVEKLAEEHYEKKGALVVSMETKSTKPQTYHEMIQQADFVIIVVDYSTPKTYQLEQYCQSNQKAYRVINTPKNKTYKSTMHFDGETDASGLHFTDSDF